VVGSTAHTYAYISPMRAVVSGLNDSIICLSYCNSSLQSVFKLYSKIHRYVYFKPSIIHAIKSRTVRWVENVEGIGKRGRM
jgi:hypothetical protein